MDPEIAEGLTEAQEEKKKGKHEEVTNDQQWQFISGCAHCQELEGRRLALGAPPLAPQGPAPQPGDRAERAARVELLEVDGSRVAGRACLNETKPN